MTYTIATTVMAVFFFFLCLWAYREGIRTGMNLAKGIAPEPFKNPVQAIVERKEAKKAKAEEDAIVQGMNNIFSYDGTVQKGGG